MWSLALKCIQRVEEPNVHQMPIAEVAFNPSSYAAQNNGLPIVCDNLYSKFLFASQYTN